MVKVSVLMAVHNAQEHLRSAMDSILDQSLEDFEFIVVDDGSTDSTPDILRSYADRRLRVLRNDANLGLNRSLNRGLREARGEYVARMDGDDISLPRRLEKQALFLDSHPEVVIAGCQALLFAEGHEYVAWYPETGEEVAAHMLLAPPFAHPAVMIRTDFLRQHSLDYDEDVPCAQDYHLWDRLLDIPGAQGANLPEVLLHYRLNQQGVTGTRRAEQDRAARDIREARLHRLRLSPSSRELEVHQAVASLQFVMEPAFVVEVERWFCRVLRANEKRGEYDGVALRKVLAHRWVDLCYDSARFGLAVWWRWVVSPLSRGKAMGLGKGLRFFLRCLLRWQGGHEEAR